MMGHLLKPIDTLKSIFLQKWSALQCPGTGQEEAGPLHSISEIWCFWKAKKWQTINRLHTTKSDKPCGSFRFLWVDLGLCVDKSKVFLASPFTSFYVSIESTAPENTEHALIASQNYVYVLTFFCFFCQHVLQSSFLRENGR